jgi:hypothetical protein
MEELMFSPDRSTLLKPHRPIFVDEVLKLSTSWGCEERFKDLRQTENGIDVLLEDPDSVVSYLSSQWGFEDRGNVTVARSVMYLDLDCPRKEEDVKFCESRMYIPTGVPISLWKIQLFGLVLWTNDIQEWSEAISIVHNILNSSNQVTHHKARTQELYTAFHSLTGIILQHQTRSI